MGLFKNIAINVVLIFVIDALWINLFAGKFYAKQLAAIGRFNEAGGFDVRVGAGITVYILMATALEVFVLRNSAIKGMSQSLFMAALLGLCIYGTYDFTNRAVLDQYPMAMVIVDVAWGTGLFAVVTFMRSYLDRFLG